MDDRFNEIFLISFFVIKKKKMPLFRSMNVFWTLDDLELKVKKKVNLEIIICDRAKFKSFLASPKFLSTFEYSTEMG